MAQLTLADLASRTKPMAEKKKHWMRKGHLTAHARQSLPKSDFALPGKGEGKKGAGSGSYPIPDESHARNALSRSSGKAVHAEVERKVHAKFPGIKIGGKKKHPLYDHPRSHHED